jgi:peroxiredoxin
VAQLRRARKDFEQAGLQVVLVGLGSPAQARDFQAAFDVSFPIVADPDGRLYAAYDLKRMASLGFLSPMLAARTVATLARGHGLGKPSGDVRQLPGVVAVDRQGRVIYRHDARDPSDHPAPEAILTALAGGA